VTTASRKINKSREAPGKIIKMFIKNMDKI
jgi:hypothetical protein